MLLYEIVEDMHWLMLTDVKHIKKSVLCAQGSFVRSLMPPMSKQRIYAYTPDRITRMFSIILLFC